MSFVVVIAFVGLTWAIAWKLASTDDPRDSSRVDAAELALIRKDAGTEQRTAQEIAGASHSAWRAVVQPSVLAIALSLFCYNYILFFFMTWFPDYLVDAQGVSLRDMSLFTAVPTVTGVIVAGDHYGSAFATAGALGIVGAVVVLVLVRQREHADVSTESSTTSNP
ncbi:MFS transporter [Rhodococcoides fascians]|uniref:MFS transporter n=1 Tax=Rhodococcoides fascians TaxID=1828 RepID=UPI0009B83020|nr:MFS transporter [Rhodococcus fascians]